MPHTTNLDTHISQMRSMGEFLMPFNQPKGDAEDEEAIDILKDREITVDGHELVCSYSKADFGDHLTESLTIFGQWSGFLPFGMVCKVARRFLGDEHLSLVDHYRDGRKWYVWTVCRSRDDVAIPSPYKDSKAEDQEFEGFRYKCMNPDTVNFY